jgi:hypothetical protein
LVPRALMFQQFTADIIVVRKSMRWTSEAIVKQQLLSKESTVYHYRLVQRVYHKTVYSVVYWAILALYFIWDLIHLQPFSIPVSLILIPLLHMVLTFLYYRLKEKRPLSQWTFQYFFIWIGYTPTSYIAARRLVRLYLHLLWTTVVICGCFYPWVSHHFIFHLLFVHLWLLIPRLFVFFRFRRYIDNGFIKISHSDTSCYVQ